jgi:tRNA A37 threonylcarbamoyladenosine modification protein TsaB
LVIANKELAYQNQEKENRAEELVIAIKELTFQNKEKEKRAQELVIGNKELAFQNQEKEKRAQELVIANTLKKKSLPENCLLLTKRSRLFHIYLVMIYKSL